MNPQSQQDRIEWNLAVIRAYLKNKFPGYAITEVEDLESYKFSVMNEDLGRHHKLKVLRSKLSDRGSTTAKIQAELERDNVAGMMVQATDYYIW